MILTKNLRGVCAIASKDSSRPSITGVLFKDGKATATDGFMLLQVPYQENPDEDSDIRYKHEGFEGILPARDVDSVLRGIPGRKSDPVHFAWSSKGRNDKIRLISTDLKQTNIKEVKPLEGTFPPIEKILDDPSEVVARVRLNPKLLKQMVDALLLTDPDAFLDIEIRGDEYKPVHLYARSGHDYEKTDIHGVIMPVRTNR